MIIRHAYTNSFFEFVRFGACTDKGRLRQSAPIAIFLQCMSALVEISSSQDGVIFLFFIFSVCSFLRRLGGLKGVTQSLFSPAAGKAAVARFAIVHKCAFENQMIFCTTADDVF